MMGAADDFTYSSGKMMMHELSEAYEGSLLSKEKGVSSPRSGVPGSVYEEAHKRATPQVRIKEMYYNKLDRETDQIRDAVRSVFYVEDFNGRRKVIQIHNYEKK